MEQIHIQLQQRLMEVQKILDRMLFRLKNHFLYIRFRRRPVKEEYDFFNNKPQQHRRGPTKEIDLDRG
jgi:hypothetical protein